MRIGVDLGGTKIEGVVLDGGGDIVWRHRVPAPRGVYADTLSAISALVHSADAVAGKDATVGIGIPGAMSLSTGLVKNASSTWLIGHPFDRDLERVLGRPVRVANDANCFALSEAADGAAAGKSVVFGVIAGTGVGGGVVFGGAAWAGHNAIAGEWGHNPLPWPTADEIAHARPCFCGKKGCIESFVSGPGFAADHALLTGQHLEPEAVVAAASRGDAEARASFDRYCDRMARALATIVNVLDPDAVVLGGGMSNADALYDELPARLPRYVFSDVCTTPILKNKHGDSSGVRGAAWLWPDAEK